MRFRDRRDAGCRLARRLGRYERTTESIVLALPRGGVPVGFEVARALGVPLDVLVVCRMGVPGCEELSMGAVTSGGISVLDTALISSLGIAATEVESVAEHERRLLGQIELLYRGCRPAADLAGWTVILVDDGVAGLATLRSAVFAVRRRGPARVILAVPVADRTSLDDLGSLVDEIVCIETPEPFETVGRWYADPALPTDEEVRELLDRAFETFATPFALAAG